MIEIKNVSKSYGKHLVLDEITLTVEDSSVLGLAGFNGSGKTTLLNICAGVYKTDGGCVLLDGGETFDNDKERKNLFYLSDDLYLPATATVKSAARFFEKYYDGFDMKLFSSICEIFNLKEKSSVRSLSKGMRRQVCLAIAFAARPKYLLIDETFDGLDPQKKEFLKTIILEYINETESSVIVASHDLGEIAEICDHVAILDGNKIVLNCPIGDVSENYRRVDLTFGTAPTEDMFKSISYRDLKISGKNATLIAFGNEADIKLQTEKLAPASAEYTRLNLEEVFKEKTEPESAKQKIKSLFKTVSSNKTEI